MTPWERKVKKFFKNPKSFIKDSDTFFYLFGDMSRKSVFELAGPNHDRQDIQKIAVFWKFMKWKREFLYQYLPDHKHVFVRRKVLLSKLEREYTELAKLGQIEFYAWGKKMPPFVREFAAKHNIPVYNVEDGFLRSFASKSFHTTPHSLAFDNQSIYYDATQPSQLENILNTYNFKSDAELLKKAEFAIDLTRAARLTKYFSLHHSSVQKEFDKTDQYTVLVVGQSEKDASIAYGSEKVRFNTQAVLQARKDFPQALILYRPHPDISVKGGMKLSSPEELEAKGVCKIVDNDIPLMSLLEKVDHVYTISSLVGMEALIRGVKVTCLGAPFYSGWGMTDDRQIVSRRKRQLSLRELVAGAYFIYPRYIHPVSGRSCGYLDIAAYFIIEKIMFLDYFTLDPKVFDVSFLKKYEQIPSVTLLVLKKIIESGDRNSLSSQDFMSCIEKNFYLEDFTQITQLLINSSNYDALKVYCDFCIEYVRDSLDQVGLKILNVFFESLSVAMRNLNGRILKDIPDITDYLIQSYEEKPNEIDILTERHQETEVEEEELEEISHNLEDVIAADGVIKIEMRKTPLTFLMKKVRRNAKISYIRLRVGPAEKTMQREKLKIIQDNFSVSYIRCLSFNLHYEYISNIIDHFEKIRFSLTPLLQKVCIILSQKPTRSERFHAERNRLLLRVAALFENSLNVTQYDSVYDLYLNACLAAVMSDSDIKTARAVNRFLALFADGEFSFANRDLAKFGNIRARRGHIVQIYNFLLKKGKIDEAKLLLQAFKGWSNNVLYNKLSLNLLTTKGLYASTIRVYSQNISDGDLSDDDASLNDTLSYVKALRAEGMYRYAKQLLQSVLHLAETQGKRLALEQELARIDFIIETGEIINSYPQPRIPKGVVFLASQTCFNSLAMIAPALTELKKKGYAVINLMQGIASDAPTGLDFIDQFSGCLPMNLYYPELNNSWTIDWHNHKVECDGVNYYQGFYERLSTAHRTYHVDLVQKAVYEDFITQLKRCDTGLTIVKRIFNEVTGRAMPTVFVSGNSHVTPFSVFRDFCRAKGHPLLTYINLNIAYENYFSNLSGKFSRTMCVTDMTLYPNIRAPFLARADQFEPWYEKNQNDREIQERAEQLITVNRNNAAGNPKEKALIEYLQAQKSEGKKILCCFGKVPVDLNVPYDGGPAHQDMADWLNHTIESCGGVNNILLLVKPHPHELRPEIALDLVDKFTDLITVPVESNVKLLGHGDINAHALAPFLDLAILWNGSTGLELTAQGVPVITASYFGKHDYPVDLIYPENRDQYFEYLRGGQYIQPDAELRKRAAFLICFMGTEEITVRNEYAVRQITNDKIGVPTWRRAEINRFLAEGDPNMRLIADRIVEKFEGKPRENTRKNAVSDNIATDNKESVVSGSSALKKNTVFERVDETV